MRKAFVALLAVCLCFAFVSCATSSSGDVSRPSVSVSGAGTVTLNADMVTFNVYVEESAPTTSQAQQLTNEKVSRILSILRDFGISDDCLSTTSLSFYSQYHWDEQTGKQVKYAENVSQYIYVKLKDLSKFSTLVDELGTVSGIGLNSVNFDVEDRTEAYNKARELAYQDAYDKACIYARCSGLGVGNPISITDGYSSYGAATYNAKSTMLVTEAAAAAPDVFYDTEAPSGTLSVNVQCSVVFELI